MLGGGGGGGGGGGVKREMASRRIGVENVCTAAA